MIPSVQRESPMLNSAYLQIEAIFKVLLETELSFCPDTTYTHGNF